MDLLPIQSDVLKFIKAGVSGFILKDANITEYYKTIRLVYQGTQVLPSHLAGSLFSQIIENSIQESKPSAVIKSIRLTKREQQVMKLISGGCANKEIALKLGISTFTVKSHVHNILEKLSLHTRVEIAKYSHISASNQAAKITAALKDDQL
jgi:DNA-binding NarL/FixJ family response regulator